MENFKNIGEFLKHLRKNLKLTRNKVEKDLEMSLNHLEQIESYRPHTVNLISQERLNKLLEYYKATPEQQKEAQELYYLQPSYVNIKHTSSLPKVHKEFLQLLKSSLPTLPESSAGILKLILEKELEKHSFSSSAQSQATQEALDNYLECTHKLSSHLSSEIKGSIK